MKKVILIFLFLVIPSHLFAEVISTHQGLEVRNKIPFFELAVPSNFVEFPLEVRQQVNVPGFLYGFIEKSANLNNTEDALMIIVAGMGGTIKAFEKMGPEGLAAVKRASPPGAKVSVEPTKILGDYNEIIRSEIEMQGMKFVVFVVQIPLLKEAIQIVFRGPASRESEIRGVFENTITTLKGTTVEEWRFGKIGSVSGVLLGIIIILLIYRKKFFLKHAGERSQ